MFSARSSLDEADPVLWVNDGRACLGRVYEARGGFVAVAEGGAEIGTFPHAQQAAAAIRQAVR